MTKRCCSRKPLPFGLTEYSAMETHSYRSVQLMRRTQCAHAACLLLGMIGDWMIHTAPPLVCNKAKMADNSIQLNTSHALQPHYRNETLHSSMSTKEELKQPIACEVNAQTLSAEQVERYKKMLPLQKHWRALAFSEDRCIFKNWISWIACHYQEIDLKTSLYQQEFYVRNLPYKQCSIACNC